MGDSRVLRRPYFLFWGVGPVLCLLCESSPSCMFVICALFHMLCFLKKIFRQRKLHFNPLYMGSQDLSSQQISCYLTWISLHLFPVYFSFALSRWQIMQPSLENRWKVLVLRVSLCLCWNSPSRLSLRPPCFLLSCSSPAFSSLSIVPCFFLFSPHISSLPTLFMNEVYAEMGKKSSAFTADKFTFSILPFKSR